MVEGAERIRLDQTGQLLLALNVVLTRAFIYGKDAKAKVWGVLMEAALPSGVATLVSIRDGTASLYTSTGGGVLGGYIAPKKAKRFVAEAEKHLVSMKPTEVFSVPRGRTDEVLRADAGRRLRRRVRRERGDA